MKNTINFWKQSSGRTGQCKTESINNLFERVAPLYEERMGLKLSKERLYDLALQKARQGKKEIEYNPRIMDLAPCVMGIILKELYSILRDYEKTETIVFENLEITNLVDIARQTIGRKNRIALYFARQYSKKSA